MNSEPRPPVHSRPGNGPWIARAAGGVLLAAGLTACGPQPPGEGPDAVIAVHPARGEIREIAADRRSAVIRHEEIPGYMPRMTMDLTVRETRELEGLAAGDVITFRLHATRDTHWIDDLRKVGRATSAPVAPEVPTAPQADNAGPAAVREVAAGDLLPEVDLLDEDGRRLRWRDYAGQAVALTFFFTRCPLPDFCPRMNRYFAEARQRLRDDPSGPANWQLLSISFDADFDKPQVLKAHATSYRGQDTDRWRFAAADAPALGRVAPALDLQLTREGGSISHNLRTVVLDTRGRVHRLFDGNRWTPDELAQAIAEAARVTPTGDP